MRVQLYGKESVSVIECLEYYVKTSNDYALHCISEGELRVAVDILTKCEKMLVSGTIGHFPNYKFQTLNNLAHAHNVSGNMRLSLKYLNKALAYAIQSDSQDSQNGIPIVETYLNLCNAHTYLGQHQQALEIAESAIAQSSKQLNEVAFMIEQSQQPEMKEHFSQVYMQQINLFALSFQTKGGILEKLKRFQDAMVEYKEGKQLVEDNYGTGHKLFVDFANALNGAKLRSKYQQSAPDYNHQSLNIVTDHQRSYDNLIQNHETDMMRPSKSVKKKRTRPGSAKVRKQTGNQLQKNLTGQSSTGFLHCPYHKPYKIQPISNLMSRTMDSPQHSTRSSSGNRTKERQFSQKNFMIRELRDTVGNIKMIQQEQHEMMKLVMQQTYQSNMNNMMTQPMQGYMPAIPFQLPQSIRVPPGYMPPLQQNYFQGTNLNRQQSPEVDSQSPNQPAQQQYINRENQKVEVWRPHAEHQPSESDFNDRASHFTQSERKIAELQPYQLAEQENLIQEEEDDFTNIQQITNRMSKKVAATKIQAAFRGNKARQNFDIIWANKDKDRLVCLKQKYLAKDKAKLRVLVLQVYLMIGQKQNQIEIILYDFKRKRTEIKVDHQLAKLGLKQMHRQEMAKEIRSMFQNMVYCGIPYTDFIDYFKHKPQLIEGIEFFEPKYYDPEEVEEFNDKKDVQSDYDLPDEDDNEFDIGEAEQYDNQGDFSDNGSSTPKAVHELSNRLDSSFSVHSDHELEKQSSSIGKSEGQSQHSSFHEEDLVVNKPMIRNAGYELKKEDFIEQALKRQLQKKAVQQAVSKVETDKHHEQQKQEALQRQKSIIMIQSHIRAFLAIREKQRRLADNVICQFTLNKGGYVHILVKKKQKGKETKYKIVAKHLEGKKNKEKLKLKELPCDQAVLHEYLQKALKLKFKKGELEEIKIDKKVDADDVHEEVKTELKENAEKKEVAAMMKDLEEFEERKKVMADRQAKVGEVKQQQQAENKAATLLQGLGRQYLAKTTYDDEYEKVNAQMLFRLTRKLSDGHYYYIFLMRKYGDSEDIMDFRYVITLRNCSKLEDIYDLQLDTNQCRKIMMRKEQPDKDKPRFLIFENNRDHFLQMLDFLDINKDGDFKLDIANFRKSMNTKESIVIIEHESEPATARFKVEAEKPQRLGQNIGSDPSSIDNSRIVDEVESKYEQSPDQSKSKKQVNFKEEVPHKEQSAYKRIQTGYKKKQGMSAAMAALIIQAKFRQQAAKKKLALMKSNQKHKLINKTFFKILSKYFSLSVYTDNDRKYVFFSLKAFKDKTTLCDMKEIEINFYLTDEGEIMDDADIAMTIKDDVIEIGEAQIVDEKGKVQADWAERLVIGIDEFFEGEGEVGESDYSKEF